MTTLHLIAAQYAHKHGQWFTCYECLKAALGTANIEHDPRKGMILSLLSLGRTIINQRVVS